MSVTIATRSPLTSTSPSPTARIAPAVLVDDQLAGHHLRDHGDVLGVDADLALDGRQRDHVHVLGEGDRLRRDDLRV